MQNIRNKEINWYVVDATDQTLGRLATKIAKILLGKNSKWLTDPILGINSKFKVQIKVR